MPRADPLADVQRGRSPRARRRAASRRAASKPLGTVARAFTFITEAPGRRSALQRDRRYRRALMGADALAAWFAIWVAVDLLGDDRLRLASLLTAPLAIVCSRLVGLYDRDEFRLRKSTLDEVPKIFQLATLYALVVAIFATQLLDGRLGSVQIIGMWALLFLGATFARGLARSLARRTTAAERCLIVGTAEGRDAVARKLEDGKGIHSELVGELSMRLDGQDPADLRELERVVRELDVDRVVLAPREADSDFILDAVRLIKSLGVKVSLLPRIFEVVGSSVVFDDLDGTTVLGVRRFGLSRSSRWLKRGVDMVGAGVGTIVVAPILAGVALAVKLDSNGPVFFRQTRIGRDGKPFEIIKFRSMIPDAEERKAELVALNEADGLFKVTEDPRITRVGRLLRRTSLDELPQLLNVLKGDMSLVGPRPLVVDEDRKVQGWHRRRLHLTPGMTGPWQVLGSSRIPLHEMVVIDYLYVANWSLFEDVKILVRTVMHMLQRGGK